MGLLNQNPASPGFAVAPDEAEFGRKLADLKRGQVEAYADGTLRALVDSLPASIAALIATSISTGTVTASGAISGATGSFSSSLSSPGASATDLSALAGLRQNAWQLYTGANTGLYGYAPSTIRAKTNLEPVPYRATDFLKCMAYVYEYKGQVAIRDDPENPEYDPSYDVPTEVGFMAEHLIKNNLGAFVNMLDGVPVGIDYAAFGAVAANVIGREMDSRLNALAKRLDAAGL